MEGSWAPWVCRTQSALREGLLDLIQHIPEQRRLVTFSVNGHRLTRLGGGGRERDRQKVKVLITMSVFQRHYWSSQA